MRLERPRLFAKDVGEVAAEHAILIDIVVSVKYFPDASLTSINTVPPVVTDRPLSMKTTCPVT